MAIDHRVVRYLRAPDDRLSRRASLGVILGSSGALWAIIAITLLAVVKW